MIDPGELTSDDVKHISVATAQVDDVVEVTVLPSHVEDGVQGECLKCALARAVSDAVGVDDSALVDYGQEGELNFPRITAAGRTFHGDAVMDSFVRAFDNDWSCYRDNDGELIATSHGGVMTMKCIDVHVA